MKGIIFDFNRGKHRLDIEEVSVIADGKMVAQDNHRGYAGKPNYRNIYILKVPGEVNGNNGCSIRAIVRTKEGTNSWGKVKLLVDKIQ